jgi:hypothetical protein
MGAKTWMLVYSKGNSAEILKSKPVLDHAATSAFVEQLFSSEKITPSVDGDLSFTCPLDAEVVAGCFPGLTIIAAKEFGIDFPSQLPARFINACPDHTVYLHAMHSAVDWFAYAIWENGQLQRALSLSPDSGILEDIGAKLPFEEPYWKGQRPAVDPEDEDDDYPLPFHPLEMAEDALLALFGYQLEGVIDPAHLQPENIPLMHFVRKKSWWRF